MKSQARPAREWKITSVRETAPLRPYCAHPELLVHYWREHVTTAPHFSPEQECLVVVVLNTKLFVRGHYVVSIGTLNECLAHPREVFRAAIIGGAYAMVVMHNHPSGDPGPSESDDRITARIRSVAEVVGIEMLDHIIVGGEGHSSYREHGWPSRSPARQRSERRGQTRRASRRKPGKSLAALTAVGEGIGALGQSQATTIHL